MQRLGLPTVGIMALGLVLGTGCSSSGSMSSSSSTIRAPEDILVSDAKVATGLAALQTLAGTASSEAKSNPEAAKKTATQAHDQWAKVEGRVKKNDPDAYLQFEDALTNLTVGAKDQDAAKVARGASGVATAAAAYLARYPG